MLGSLYRLFARIRAVFQLVPQRFPREIGVTTGIVGAAGGFGLGYPRADCHGCNLEPARELYRTQYIRTVRKCLIAV